MTIITCFHKLIFLNKSVKTTTSVVFEAEVTMSNQSQVPILPEVVIDSAESQRRAMAKSYLEYLKRKTQKNSRHFVCEKIPNGFYWEKHPSENHWLGGIANRFEECGYATSFENRMTYFRFDRGGLTEDGKKWHMCLSWASTGTGDKIDV